ncbi:mitochondrial carrier domain-containing protein [Scheffersomyces amazonensis]|uniref:mitochondrial carrier domain-containing protein n=1 Tax=Scheffersomyces amazonensis TaxID=1078765 RepID=UPI00315CE7D4
MSESFVYQDSQGSLAKPDLHKKQKPQQDELHPLKEITFGAVSGMFGKLIEYPLDTIKVRLQATSTSSSPSTLAMIRSTYHNEGIIDGFYKGLKAPLIGACMETGILFSSYNFALSKIRDPNSNDEPHMGLKCLSGGFAGAMASFVLTPIELIKCQLQVSNLASTASSTTSATRPNSLSYIPLVQNIIKKDGVTGLWNGLTSTLIREIVGTAIWFGTYEYVSGINALGVGEDINSLISGAIAGLTFNFSIFPIDTVKSNIQTHDILKKASGKVSPGSLDFLRVTKQLITKQGGIRNLYNGLGITLIRCVPANAIIFYSYEVLKRNF